MTAVDFLPAAYRQRLARRRVARERMLLAVPVALGLLATDLVLRHRVRNVRRMTELANVHAESGEQRGGVARALVRRISALQAGIDVMLPPLEAQRMTEHLDGLLADSPPDVTFHELVCRQSPWSGAGTPTITLQASTTSPETFTPWLDAMQRHPHLPPLRCQRTFAAGANGAVGFELRGGPAEAAR